MSETTFRKHGARFALFSGVGAFNTATDFLVYGALVATGASPLAANAAGFLAANAQSYVVNGRLTFRENGRPAAMSAHGFAKFLAAHALSLVVSTATIALAAQALGAVGAKVLAALLTAAWNYASSALFAFRSGARS